MNGIGAGVCCHTPIVRSVELMTVLVLVFLWKRRAVWAHPASHFREEPFAE